MALWKRLWISWLTSSAKHSKPGFKSLLNSFWVDSCENNLVAICSWLKVDFTLYRVRNYTWQLAQVLENAATEGQNYATSCSQSGLTSHYEHCPESKEWASRRGHWIFTKSAKWFTRWVNVVFNHNWRRQHCFNHLRHGNLHAHFSWFYIEWMLGIRIGPAINLLMVLYKYQTQVVKSVDTPGPGNINRNTLESALVLTFEQLKVWVANF